MKNAGKLSGWNNFFNDIEDVLTRLMKGETDYKSLIPCNYKLLPSGEEQKEVARTRKIRQR